MKKQLKHFVSILFLSLLIISINESSAQTGWMNQFSGTSQELRGAFFVNSQTGWVVGFGGIRKTTNGGINWFPQNSGISYGLISVHFVNEYTGWAAGGNQPSFISIIIKTTNGGQSWFTQYFSSVLGDVLEIFFIDSNTGWAVCAGNYGWAINTTNGGQNWTVQNTNISTNLTSCFFLDQNTGWVVGDQGSISKTTNGGNNWMLQFCSTSENLEGIYMLNSNTGFVVGNGGYCFKTTNSGLNWIAKPTGSYGWLNSVYFIDNNTGWIVGGAYNGGNSEIFKTTDSGENWYSQTSPTTYWLADVKFSNSNTGWAVGRHGVIINTITGGDPLAIPILISPPNGSNNVPLTPTLFWNHISSVTHYKVQVSRVSNFSVLTDSATVAINQYPVPPGTLTNTTTYFWRVNATNSTGTGPWSEVWSFSTIPVGIKKISSLIPELYKLFQNYPNPFNPSTTIRFDIPKPAYVKIVVYDNLGRIVSELVNEKLDAGCYEVNWNPQNISSGIYFYRLETEEFSDVKKMLFIK